MDIRLAADIARVATEPRSATRESTNVSSSQTTSDVTGAGSGAGSGETAAAENVRAASSGQFYVSPFLTFDSRSLTVIFQVRDTESGDVTRQFPSETVVERYRRDPSARPFVLPEPAASDDGQQAGPPPPTIGGPVAEAASEQEQRPTGGDPAAQETTLPGSDDGRQSSPATPRPAVDLVA
ncbi:MAG: hypothetical protein P1U88_14865 [Thalassobaculaceae bacterium]|nr:hypothetical protein [Thalassobaculaceae bacterium]